LEIVFMDIIVRVLSWGQMGRNQFVLFLYSHVG
jgi:hypothetical protein